jgi:CheY-like chemotaxis protein
MGRRVLIVEDEALQAESLAALLRLRGHEACGVAKSGEAAIDLAKRTFPEVALVDVRLAGAMDGVDAAAVLDAWFGCEIVFLTAAVDDRTTERMRRARPIAVLTKPASASEIFAAIERSGGGLGKIGILLPLVGAVEALEALTADPEGVESEGMESVAAVIEPLETATVTDGPFTNFSDNVEVPEDAATLALHDA